MTRAVPITLSQFAYIDWRVPSEVEYKKLVDQLFYLSPRRFRHSKENNFTLATSQRGTGFVGLYPSAFRPFVVTVSIICFWLSPEPPTGLTLPKLTPKFQSPQ